MLLSRQVSSRLATVFRHPEAFQGLTPSMGLNLKGAAIEGLQTLHETLRDSGLRLMGEDKDKTMNRKQQPIIDDDREDIQSIPRWQESDPDAKKKIANEKFKKAQREHVERSLDEEKGYNKEQEIRRQEVD